MSAKLTKALEFANYRITLNNQQQVLKSKMDNLLLYSVNGGTFSITRELIVFCKTMMDNGDTEAILLDNYGHPIKVELADFYEQIFSRYYEVINEYYVEYEKLRKARKTQSVVEINEKE